MCTSHEPGRKSNGRFLKSYLTIWCDFGSTQSVTSETLFSRRCSSASYALSFGVFSSA